MPHSKWKLFTAAKYGDLKVGKRAVEKGIDVNVLDNEGMTAVHWAVRHKQFDVCRWLIQERKADVDVVDSRGKTPLQYAAQENCHQFVSLLVHDGGADAEIQNQTGQTPLLIAAYVGATEFVRAMIVDGGADTTVVDRHGLGVWHYCCRSRAALEFAKVLVELKIGGINESDPSGKSPLHFAMSFCPRGDAVEFLIQNGADVNYANRKTGRTPLHLAARNGNIKLAKLLVDAGADPKASDNEGSTVLHEAVKRRYGWYQRSTEFILWLTKHCDLDFTATNEAGETALDIGREDGNQYMVFILKPLVENARWKKVSRCVLTDSVPAGALPLVLAQLARGDITGGSKYGEKRTGGSTVDRVWELVRERPDLLYGAVTRVTPTVAAVAAADGGDMLRGAIREQKRRGEETVGEQSSEHRRKRQRTQ